MEGEVEGRGDDDGGGGEGWGEEVASQSNSEAHDLILRRIRDMIDSRPSTLWQMPRTFSRIAPSSPPHLIR